MTIMGILWFYLPNITLIGFLLFSAFHFGQADIKSWELGQNKSILWGISVLIFLLGTHQHETNEILSSITSISLPIEISPLFLIPWLNLCGYKKESKHGPYTALDCSHKPTTLAYCLRNLLYWSAQYYKLEPINRVFKY
jgi:hypothetical protein